MHQECSVGEIRIITVSQANEDDVRSSEENKKIQKQKRTFLSLMISLQIGEH
jgi:hypothetical protein